jgi:hypothetical protein
VQKLSDSRLARLREWGAPLLDAATRTGPYPNWLMAGIKVAVAIGFLTVATAWTMDRSAKAQLAKLAQDAFAQQAEPAKPRRR